MAADLDPAVLDALYGEAPEAFVARRKALARELRAEGRREEAKAVDALRKPTHSAWLLNRLVREDPEPARAALAARERLHEVQEQAFSGTGGMAELRTAIRAEREAIDAVLAAVRALDGDAGDVVLQRIRETVQAAAQDRPLREALLAGRVAHEVRPEAAWPDGGGELLVMAPEPEPEEEAEAEAEPEPEPRRDRAGERAARRAAERERKEHLGQVRRRERHARAAAARAAREVAKAAAARERAEAALATAREEEAAARDDEARARQAAEDAAAELARLND